MSKGIYDEVVDHLEQGTSPVEVADLLGLDVSTDEDVVVLPGWYADDGNAEVYYPYETSGEEAAREYVDDGVWGEGMETTWHRIMVWRQGLGVDHDGAVVEVNLDEDTHTIEIDPEEPDCEAGGSHKWRDAGVIGHGGGVITTEICIKCGLKKTTDTWAQDRVTGQQGLTSISYEKPDYDYDDDY